MVIVSGGSSDDIPAVEKDLTSDIQMADYSASMSAYEMGHWLAVVLGPHSAVM